jgi:hypothetical protein
MEDDPIPEEGHEQRIARVVDVHRFNLQVDREGQLIGQVQRIDTTSQVRHIHIGVRTGSATRPRTEKKGEMDILAIGEGRTEVCHERGIGRHGSESSSGGSGLGKLDSIFRLDLRTAAALEEALRR